MPFNNVRIPTPIIILNHGVGNPDQCNQIRKTNKRHISQDEPAYAAVHKKLNILVAQPQEFISWLMLTVLHGLAEGLDSLSLREVG